MLYWNDFFGQCTWDFWMVFNSRWMLWSCFGLLLCFGVVYFYEAATWGGGVCENHTVLNSEEILWNTSVDSSFIVICRSWPFFYFFIFIFSIFVGFCSLLACSRAWAVWDRRKNNNKKQREWPMMGVSVMWNGRPSWHNMIRWGHLKNQHAPRSSFWPTLPFLASPRWLVAL